MISRAKVFKADAILAILNELVQEYRRLYLELYSNGREQGYHIKNHNTQQALSFSECRNTDQIVVYCGHFTLFTMQGNVPNEEVYRNAKYFKHDEYVEAAQYIYAYLNKESCEEDQ